MAIGAKQHRLAGQSDHMFPGGQGRIEQRSERGAAAAKCRRPRRREEEGKKAEPVANDRQWQVERPKRREQAAKGAAQGSRGGERGKVTGGGRSGIATGHRRGGG